MVRASVLRSVLVNAVMATVLVGGDGWAATETLRAPDAVVGLSQLPTLGQKTYRLIRQGGPFPYAKDGQVFGNREGLLPRYKRGYYREYTVLNPSSVNRGVQRIVCGGAAQRPDVCYYTADHYASFRQIEPLN